MWHSVIEGLCKVSFLCNSGEPKWLLIGIISAIIFLFPAELWLVLLVVKKRRLGPNPEPWFTTRRGSPLTLRSPSTVTLIAANLVPFAGVILFGWDMSRIMVLYWAESAIIGVFNLLKMAVVGKWVILFLGPFFLGHYGAFMGGHLLFIYFFFIESPTEAGAIPLPQVAADFVVLWPALVALLMSHALSFYLNFIGRREYEGRQISQQMSEPYKRIIVMHVTIIFGGLLVLVLDSVLPALILLIVLKIAADVRAHLHERIAGELASEHRQSSQ